MLLDIFLKFGGENGHLLRGQSRGYIDEVYPTGTPGSDFPNPEKQPDDEKNGDDRKNDFPDHFERLSLVEQLVVEKLR